MIGGLFHTYFEGYLQELEQEGKVTRRQAAMVRGYANFANNPRNVPLLDGFIEYVRRTAPEDVVLRDSGRENNAKIHP